MKKAPVSFLTGFSPRKGVLGLPSKPDSDGGQDYLSRVFTYDNGNWGLFEQELEFAPKGMTYLLDDSQGYRAWWVVGRNGETAEIRKGVTALGQIPGAGTRSGPPIYGNIEAIKCIGKSVFACGGGRQVYRLGRTGWECISKDILTEERGVGFFDVDGTDESYLYAVGFRGEIWRYDGRWELDSSPTSNILTSVRVVDKDNIWICGNRRTLLHGTFNKWQEYASQGADRNFYCVEEYEGAAYVAGNRSLWKALNGEVELVDTRLGKASSTHKLSARDGLLWSVGEKDILVFDGAVWREIVHPDNT